MVGQLATWVSHFWCSCRPSEKWRAWPHLEPNDFSKAIQGSSDYDEQFADELSKGTTPIDAYWEMVIADINGAADVFQSLYDSSNGGDGFVGVEVDPRLAHDGHGTLSAARRLHEVVNRANVMIKIPATQEGIPAIREMIAEDAM